MSDTQSSYRQIMKATSIFGGVQLFQIIIQVIRSKFVAVLLGPTGMGISGLLLSTLGLIGGLTNFGLATSAVKDVATAHSTGNEVRIATVAKVLKRLVWITGLLGTVFTFVFSSWLSQITFGNKDYTMAFIWLSITLLFNQLTTGQTVLLQGMRKLQYLAKASMTGSVVGLIITVPLYYKYGINGIVPAIIMASIISFVIPWYFSRKIYIAPIKVSKVRTIAESKSMLIMGFMLTLSGLISLGTSYILRIFIVRYGNLADVGLYNAGFAIINTYVGMIFTAMATDYYPRLSGVASNNIQSKQIINNQAEIALLILAPILIAFLVFINVIVVLLYSNQFVAVNDMIYWAALGMFFKAISWSIGFIFLAKGASRLFFFSELLSSLYILVLNILGYYFGGLTGLGVSFLVGYLIYLIQVFLISRFKYKFSIDIAIVKIFLFQFSLALSSFLVVRFVKQPYPYIIGTVLIVLSSWYSIKELDKRIGIKELLSRLIKK